MEEQSDCASAVIVKAEGIDSVDKLRDVSREDCDEEGSCGYSDCFLRCRDMSARPRAISTTPDARTMKSGVKGAHGGT